ncbi:unnamed protein product [Ectocarpus sp. CCAP 1310/34]|nr:unnamed protein product [Ectocarpus sp. CCAP 1310/34]
MEDPAPAPSAGADLRLPGLATHLLQMRCFSSSSNMLPQLLWSRPPHPPLQTGP